MSNEPSQVEAIRKNELLVSGDVRVGAYQEIEELESVAGGNKNKRSKRGKTFTGCWTCRSRKVKCDLRRPTCKRCEKSGLECGGYDIKLRWSKPIKFDLYGSQLPVLSAGESSGANMTDEPQYRRRNIDFVKYKDEYQFYEDMDEELTALHNPPIEKVNDNKTWILKKFGVFRGIDKVDEQNERPRKKKRKLEKFQNPSFPTISSIHNTPSNTNTPDFLDNDVFMMQLSPANHEWISNELRDDAVLSASALQGFPIANFQFSSTSSLDDPNHNDIVDNNGNRVSQTDDAILQQALRLLFHRHSPVDVPNIQPAQQVTRNLESVVPLENNIDLDCFSSGSSMPSIVMELVSSALPDAKIFNLPKSTNPFLNLPTTGLQVHGLARFLLNYYIQYVADLMTVVALTTNPWKTLYFPRALKAIGDLAGLGYTSNSRNSLLNALMAVSCFNLKSKFPKNSPESQFFLNLGIEFRKQASNFLKICLSTTVGKERYKDVLTAILSMNSIDVVWGTMADCQHHLTICEDFIEARMKARPKISEKAKVLHRIFSFLKLIQDSTALDKVRDKEIVIRSNIDGTDKDMGPYEDVEDKSKNEGGQDTYGCSKEDDETQDGQFRESLNRIDGKIQIEFIKSASAVQHSSGSTPIFSNIASESYYSADGKITETDILSTDALYGLPKSLILLFSDCVRLVRHNEYYNMNHMPVPREFTTLCLRFERRLLKWTSEWRFQKNASEEFVSDTLEGVYHHTMSFYYSLVIYYFTMARSLGYQLLQTYVEKVLFHLKALGDLIKLKNVKIVPLIWQGFIAGCASTEIHVQEEFRTWAATLAASGMGSYWGARQVMFEVWRRRTNEEQGDSWYAVYRDWEMNLMLS